MQVNAEGQTLIVQQNTRCLPRRTRVVHCTISTRQSYCQTQNIGTLNDKTGTL